MEFVKNNAEEKHSASRRLSRSGRNQKAVILEAISHLSGGETSEDGRVKIVVKKEDLKQVLEAIRDGRRRNTAAVSLEQRLSMMRRRQMMRGVGRNPGLWRPALQSIPEEF